MKDRVKVALLDQGGSKKTLVTMPTNFTVGKLLPYIIKTLKLPEGRYNLVLESEGRAINLGENDMLSEIGVQDGSVLRILPQMTGGS